MIELWVRHTGLRLSHDPDDPKMTDIRKTDRLAQIADRVILQTKNAAFVRKDSEGSSYVRVEFDGELLSPVPIGPGDLGKLEQMKDALHEVHRLMGEQA